MTAILEVMESYKMHVICYRSVHQFEVETPSLVAHLTMKRLGTTENHERNVLSTTIAILSYVSCVRNANVIKIYKSQW